MNPVKIGWGRREISLDERMIIPGQAYMRISEGIHDPLYATALCVDGGQGQDAVIFCTCDYPIFWGGIVELVARRAAAMRPEIPGDAIILCATHTHAAPEVRDVPDVSPDGEQLYAPLKYREFFCRQCAEAICEAWDTRAEGGIAYGYGYAVVGHSRRVVYFDDVSLRSNPNPAAPNGHCVMYGNTNDPNFSHYEAGADHFLNAVFTFDKAQKLTGIVVNVPCPSQLSEHFTKQSADFWNEVRQMVAKEYGEDVYVLPQCAPAGDLAPRTMHYKQAQARRMALKYDLHYDVKKARVGTQDLYNKVMAERYDIAERILDGVRDIYSWAKKDIKTQIPVRHKRLRLELARRMITDGEKAWCEENIEAMSKAIPDPQQSTPEQYRKAVSNYEWIKDRNEQAISNYAQQAENPTRPMWCHAVQLGDIAFATNMYELYMDFMHRLQARSPFIQTFVIQIAADECDHYLATKRAVENKGYSASIFCNLISPEGGQQWVDTMVRQLQEMKEQA